MFSSAMDEGSFIPPSLPALIVFVLCNVYYSHLCEVSSHCFDSVYMLLVMVFMEFVYFIVVLTQTWH